MERLTTNKKVSEMEMDARDFARNLMVTLTKDELPLDKTEFDEEILDNLTIDPFSDVRGLIAVFYRNLWAMADLREKLKCYEDAEEQGLLLRLLCGIGTDIYYIPSEKNFRLNLLDGHGEENRVFHKTVDRITFRKNGWYMEYYPDLEYGTGRILLDTSYGVTWFLTSEEAEAKLKEMEGRANGNC